MNSQETVNGSILLIAFAILVALAAQLESDAGISTGFLIFLGVLGALLAGAGIAWFWQRRRLGRVARGQDSEDVGALRVPMRTSRDAVLHSQELVLLRDGLAMDDGTTGRLDAPEPLFRWWDDVDVELVEHPVDELRSEVALRWFRDGAATPCCAVRALWPREYVDPSVRPGRAERAPWISASDLVAVFEHPIEQDAHKHDFVMPVGVDFTLPLERIDAMLGRDVGDGELDFLPTADPTATVDASLTDRDDGRHIGRLEIDDAEVRLHVGASDAADAPSVHTIDLRRPFAASLSRSIDDAGLVYLHCELRQSGPARGRPSWVRVGFSCESETFERPIVGVPMQAKSLGVLAHADARHALARIRAALVELGDAQWGAAEVALVEAEQVHEV